jgi:hypothetical protein
MQGKKPTRKPRLTLYPVRLAILLTVEQDAKLKRLADGRPLGAVIRKLIDKAVTD